MHIEQAWNYYFTTARSWPVVELEGRRCPKEVANLFHLVSTDQKNKGESYLNDATSNFWSPSTMQQLHSSSQMIGCVSKKAVFCLSSPSEASTSVSKAKNTVRSTTLQSSQPTEAIPTEEIPTELKSSPPFLATNELRTGSAAEQLQTIMYNLFDREYEFCIDQLHQSIAGVDEEEWVRQTRIVEQCLVNGVDQDFFFPPVLLVEEPCYICCRSGLPSVPDGYPIDITSNILIPSEFASHGTWGARSQSNPLASNGTSNDFKQLSGEENGGGSIEDFAPGKENSNVSKEQKIVIRTALKIHAQAPVAFVGLHFDYPVEVEGSNYVFFVGCTFSEGQARRLGEAFAPFIHREPISLLSTSQKDNQQIESEEPACGLVPSTLWAQRGDGKGALSLSLQTRSLLYECDVFGSSCGTGVLCMDQTVLRIIDSSFCGSTMHTAALELQHESQASISHMNVSEILGCGLVALDQSQVVLADSIIEKCGISAILGTDEAYIEISNCELVSSGSGVNIGLSAKAICKMIGSAVNSRSFTLGRTRQRVLDSAGKMEERNSCTESDKSSSDQLEKQQLQALLKSDINALESKCRKEMTLSEMLSGTWMNERGVAAQPLASQSIVLVDHSKMSARYCEFSIQPADADIGDNVKSPLVCSEGADGGVLLAPRRSSTARFEAVKRVIDAPLSSLEKAMVLHFSEARLRIWSVIRERRERWWELQNDDKTPPLQEGTSGDFHRDLGSTLPQGERSERRMPQRPLWRQSIAVTEVEENEPRKEKTEQIEKFMCWVKEMNIPPSLSMVYGLTYFLGAHPAVLLGGGVLHLLMRDGSLLTLKDCCISLRCSNSLPSLVSSTLPDSVASSSFHMEPAAVTPDASAQLGGCGLNTAVSPICPLESGTPPFWYYAQFRCVALMADFQSPLSLDAIIPTSHELITDKQQDDLKQLASIGRFERFRSIGWCRLRTKVNEITYMEDNCSQCCHLPGLTEKEKPPFTGPVSTSHGEGNFLRPLPPPPPPVACRCCWGAVYFTDPMRRCSLSSGLTVCCPPEEGLVPKDSPLTSISLENIHDELTALAPDLPCPPMAGPAAQPLLQFQYQWLNGKDRCITENVLSEIGREMKAELKWKSGQKALKRAKPVGQLDYSTEVRDDGGIVSAAHDSIGSTGSSMVKVPPHSHQATSVNSYLSSDLFSSSGSTFVLSLRHPTDSAPVPRVAVDLMEPMLEVKAGTIDASLHENRFVSVVGSTSQDVLRQRPERTFCCFEYFKKMGLVTTLDNSHPTVNPGKLVGAAIENELKKPTKLQSSEEQSPDIEVKSIPKGSCYPEIVDLGGIAKENRSMLISTNGTGGGELFIGRLQYTTVFNEKTSQTNIVTASSIEDSVATAIQNPLSQKDNLIDRCCYCSNDYEACEKLEGGAVHQVNFEPHQIKVPATEMKLPEIDREKAFSTSSSRCFKALYAVEEEPSVTLFLSTEQPQKCHHEVLMEGMMTNDEIAVNLSERESNVVHSSVGEQVVAGTLSGVYVDKMNSTDAPVSIISAVEAELQDLVESSLKEVVDVPPEDQLVAAQTEEMRASVDNHCSTHEADLCPPDALCADREAAIGDLFDEEQDEKADSTPQESVCKSTPIQHPLLSPPSLSQNASETSPVKSSGTPPLLSHTRPSRSPKGHSKDMRGPSYVSPLSALVAVAAAVLTEGHEDTSETLTPSSLRKGGWSHPCDGETISPALPIASSSMNGASKEARQWGLQVVRQLFRLQKELSKNGDTASPSKRSISSGSSRKTTKKCSKSKYSSPYLTTLTKPKRSKSSKRHVYSRSASPSANKGNGEKISHASANGDSCRDVSEALSEGKENWKKEVMSGETAPVHGFDAVKEPETTVLQMRAAPVVHHVVTPKSAELSNADSGGDVAEELFNPLSDGTPIRVMSEAEEWDTGAEVQKDRKEVSVDTHSTSSAVQTSISDPQYDFFPTSTHATLLARALLGKEVPGNEIWKEIKQWALASRSASEVKEHPYTLPSPGAEGCSVPSSFDRSSSRSPVAGTQPHMAPPTATKATSGIDSADNLAFYSTPTNTKSSASTFAAIKALPVRSILGGENDSPSLFSHDQEFSNFINLARQRQKISALEALRYLRQEEAENALPDQSNTMNTEVEKEDAGVRNPSWATKSKHLELHDAYPAQRPSIPLAPPPNQELRKHQKGSLLSLQREARHQAAIQRSRECCFYESCKEPHQANLEDLFRLAHQLEAQALPSTGGPLSSRSDEELIEVREDIPCQHKPEAFSDERHSASKNWFIGSAHSNPSKAQSSPRSVRQTSTVRSHFFDAAPRHSPRPANVVRSVSQAESRCSSRRNCSPTPQTARKVVHESDLPIIFDRLAYEEEKRKKKLKQLEQLVDKESVARSSRSQSSRNFPYRRRANPMIFRSEEAIQAYTASLHKGHRDRVLAQRAERLTGAAEAVALAEREEIRQVNAKIEERERNKKVRIYPRHRPYSNDPK